MPTTSRRTPTRLLTFLGALAALAIAFGAYVRPWYLRWGATTDETHRALPGDSIVPNAGRQETRAVTIQAGADRVWPWVAQIGQTRGGFYSYDLLENLVGCDMPVEDYLRPEAQSWQVGDSLWMYPKDRADGVGFAILRVFTPGRALAFGTHAPGTSPSAPEDGSWTFVVEPRADSTTRLLIRGRGAPGRSLLGVAFDQAVFEPMHFAMERRLMLGIRQLAEGGDRERLRNHVMVALWAVAFLLTVIAAILLFTRDHWIRTLVAFMASAAVFQVLTLGQPALPIAVGLLFGVSLLVLWPAQPAPAHGGAAGPD
jgi:hypothetical protein